MTQLVVANDTMQSSGQWQLFDAELARRCTLCGEVKSVDEFYLRRASGIPNARFSRCKRCCAQISIKYASGPSREAKLAKAREWNALHPGAMRESWLRRYHLTPEQYDDLLAAQGGGCVLCGSTDPGPGRKHFAIDHDHACCPGSYSCGRCIRGLLCVFCNAALGQARDDPALLRRMALYLEQQR